MRLLLLGLLLLPLGSGCVSAEDDHPPPPAGARRPDPPPDVGPVPPDEGEPVAPPLAPPPARGGLDRDQVVSVARGHDDPQDAIAVLDASRFTFPLDDAALAWFGDRGLHADVLDYLRKRSLISWDRSRGDVDPDGDPGR